MRNAYARCDLPIIHAAIARRPPLAKRSAGKFRSRAFGQCIDSGVPSYRVRQALEHGLRTDDILVDETADLETRLGARHADA